MGNLYISGWTRGSLEGINAGGIDVFLSKFDASGTFQWTRQFGTRGDDKGLGVSADGLGNVYISGEADGTLGESRLVAGGETFNSRPGIQIRKR